MIINKDIYLPSGCFGRLQDLMSSPDIRARAAEMARRTKMRGDARPLEVIENNFVQGLSVEGSASEWLRSCRLDVVQSKDWRYDAIVNGKILVDFKSAWTKDPKSFTRTKAEHAMDRQLGDSVLYLCLTVCDRALFFNGAAGGFRMQNSKRGDGTGYVMTSWLKDLVV